MYLAGQRFAKCTQGHAVTRLDQQQKGTQTAPASSAVLCPTLTSLETCCHADPMPVPAPNAAAAVRAWEPPAKWPAGVHEEVGSRCFVHAPWGLCCILARPLQFSLMGTMRQQTFSRLLLKHIYTPASELAHLQRSFLYPCVGICDGAPLALTEEQEASDSARCKPIGKTPKRQVHQLVPACIQL